jgi:predicted ATPase with chaperone activity
MPRSRTDSALATLLTQRAEIIQRLNDMPPFRRGTVSEQARTCGKPSCRCQQSSDHRHVAYQWTASINGKTAHKTLHLGPEVEKYLDETTNYKQYQELMARFLHINEQIADLQKPETITSDDELEALKKKLRTQLSRQRITNAKR